MLQAGLHDEHPGHLSLGPPGADLVYEIPLLAPLARKAGHTRACPANAHARLLSGELVGVFPEGFKGIGKPFSERYRLRRFGRGGFAPAAHPAPLRSSRPPSWGPRRSTPEDRRHQAAGGFCSACRTCRSPRRSRGSARWGLIPLPSKWYIVFCPPVPTSDYPPGSEDDPAVIADLSGRVRGTIQRKLDDLLSERGPAFG